MSISDFAHKSKIKKRATLNITVYRVPSSIELGTVDLYLRDGPFSSDVGIVNLHPAKGTHWVVFINEHYFNSYGFSLP